MYFVCVFESDGVRSSARNKYIVFFLFSLKAGKINILYILIMATEQ